MSLYNMLFGENPDAAKILSTIGLTLDDFFRFRDCHVEDDGTIAVYTRGGGGNRECWNFEGCTDDETSHDSGCVVPVQDHLRSHPGYIDDLDDDFDCTFCTFRFRPANEIAIREFQSGVRGEALWPAFFAQIDAKRVSE